MAHIGQDKLEVSTISPILLRIGSLIPGRVFKLSTIHLAWRTVISAVGALRLMA